MATLPATAREAGRCPEPLVFAAQKAELQAAIRAARNESAGRLLGRELDALRRMAPDRRAQRLLDQGIAATEARAFDMAAARLSALITYCPDFAEGWHARARLQVARGNAAAALADLDRAIALAPDHGVARGQRAALLWYLGRFEEARAALDAALDINPWLPQRRLAQRLRGLAV